MMWYQLLLLSALEVLFSESAYMSPETRKNPEQRGMPASQKYSDTDDRRFTAHLRSPERRQGERQRNHILLILVDDMGWNDVSFHGSSQIPTPNLDALASAGVILQSHYSHPMCTPTRSALLSGLYPFHTGMQNYVIRTGEPWGLPLHFDILPKYLKRNNYKSHLRGKWHIGMYTEKHLPTSRGFDSYAGFLNGFVDYDTHEHIKPFHPEIGGIDWHRNNTPENQEGYATHVLKNETLDLIRNRDPNDQLFIFLGHLAPHAGCEKEPFQAPQSSIELFSHIEDPNRRTYAAMMHEMDQSVGEIVEALHQNNILKQTTIIFMSDNGGQTSGPLNNTASNYPLRGQKRTLFEGGTRVASFVWSADIQKKRRVESGLIHVTDWLPTILGRAGVEIPPNLDGVDQWDMLSNGAPSARSEVIYNLNYVDQSAAIRDKRFKLIVGPRNGTTKLNSWTGSHGSHLDFERLDVKMDDSLTARTLKAAGEWWKTKEATEKGLSRWRNESQLKCKILTGSNCDLSRSACLFDLEEDPCERDNVISKFPEEAKRLSDRLVELSKNQHAANNLPSDSNSTPKTFQDYWKPWITS